MPFNMNHHTVFSSYDHTDNFYDFRNRVIEQNMDMIETITNISVGITNSVQMLEEYEQSLKPCKTEIKDYKPFNTALSVSPFVVTRKRSRTSYKKGDKFKILYYIEYIASHMEEEFYKKHYNYTKMVLKSMEVYKSFKNNFLNHLIENINSIASIHIGRSHPDKELEKIVSDWYNIMGKKTEKDQMSEFFNKNLNFYTKVAIFGLLACSNYKFTNELIAKFHPKLTKLILIAKNCKFEVLALMDIGSEKSNLYDYISAENRQIISKILLTDDKNKYSYTKFSEIIFETFSTHNTEKINLPFERYTFLQLIAPDNMYARFSFKHYCDIKDKVDENTPERKCNIM